MAKRTHKSIPCCLAIGGSDSGGGAGVQADLKVFAALGVHGVTAVTCLTAQNPRRVAAIQPARAGMVRSQMEAVFEAFPVRAAKVGMLYHAAAAREVADFFERRKRVPLVVDPLMESTSGRALIQPGAGAILVNRLLPRATLITPNAPEAEQLTGISLREPEDLRQAARQLVDRFGGACLVKGGHLRGGSESVDVFFDGNEELLLTAPRARGIRTHGTGCTYAAAITAYLGLGMSLADAVVEAKTFVSLSIHEAVRVGRHWVLGRST